MHAKRTPGWIHFPSPGGPQGERDGGQTLSKMFWGVGMSARENDVWLEKNPWKIRNMTFGVPSPTLSKMPRCMHMFFYRDVAGYAVECIGEGGR